MTTRLHGLARGCCLIGRLILSSALVTWVAAAPLVWILRDGLAPGMVESVGTKAVFKFLMCWGIPAMMLVVPLVGLSAIERRCQPARGDRPTDERESDGDAVPQREE